MNGVLSLAYKDEALFVGSGDAKLKKLVGYESKWVLEREVLLDSRIIALNLSPDGSELLAGTANGKIYRVDTQTLSATVHTEGHLEGINDLAFPKGSSEIFATIDGGGNAIVWDTSNLNAITRTTPGTNNRVPGMSVCIAEDNSIVCGYQDGFIRAFDVTGNRFSPLKWEVVNGHRGPVTCIYAVSFIL